eukprot:NODE_8665_length_658_cov_32.400000_g8040_i0.p1 GENE.NODE_8665_length_658_cov_32.400000_g8040_i0~~NODE_8665_length_658_cov_32.400000_g8040_i0.p1  ORF type:complete len:177 (+),score=25.80 NODE_8665_length_658_cov_32.400000_g8040_i0:51-581(+)
MVYHSVFNESASDSACGCSVLPLRTKCKGPAPLKRDEGQDILDEVLSYFKANMLYKTFDVKGSADRVLIYMTLYVQLCLKRITKQTKDKASKTLYALAQEPFTIPGEAGFILPGFIPAPSSNEEGELWRQYIKQLREEVGVRLVEKVFENPEEGGMPGKWWMMFAKRKFLNKSFEN